MLAAIDVNFGAIEVGRGVRTQHVNNLGDFVGRAEPVHRNMFDDLLSSRGQHRRVDFAGRDGGSTPQAPPLMSRRRRPQKDALANLRSRSH